MPTECSATLFEFPPLDGRQVVASFDGGAITTDAGALLLGQTDRAIRLTERFAACFADTRTAELVEHQVETMVMQRVVGVALGYEDLNDHDELRRDPVLAVLAGKLEAQRSDCAPLAGKSTLNRLELSRPEPTRYHKISHDPEAIESRFVELFLDAHKKAPKQIVLDLDATDDPLHGNQEGRFFHGYYDCYCYLPLYIFCGRHLLAAKLRRANADAAAGAVEETARLVAQIRRRWPRVRILLRGDFGFCRDTLMAWCETNRVDYVFGLARNERLEQALVPEVITATIETLRTGRTARCFKECLMGWAVSNPDKRRALAQLAVSDGITPTNRAAGYQTMADIGELLERWRANGPMSKVPAGFVIGIMTSLAEATIDFMIQDPTNAEKHCKVGFDALWRMIALVPTPHLAIYFFASKMTD